MMSLDPAYSIIQPLDMNIFLRAKGTSQLSAGRIMLPLRK